jgi:hypothetical protein
MWNGGNCRPSMSVKPYSAASCPAVNTRPDLALFQLPTVILPLSKKNRIRPMKRGTTTA